MKKIFLLICIMSSVVTVSAQVITIYSGNAYNYSEFLHGLTDKQFEIRYDTEELQFYFHTANILESGWIKISRQDLITLRKTLNKFLDWEKTAIAKSVELNKELPNSKLLCNVAWEFGDDWYHGSSLLMDFKFFSQNTQRHQLIIHSDKISSNTNEFVDYKLDALYFDKSQVKSFLQGISVDSIKKAIGKYDRAKEMDDLFK